MRYATALVAALALGASASLYTPRAAAGVVVSVGLPLPFVLPRIGYFPYGPAPAVAIGPGAISLGFAPAFYGRGWFGPALRSPGYFRPGFVRGGFAYGRDARGGYFHGGFRR